MHINFANKLYLKYIKGGGEQSYIYFTYGNQLTKIYIFQKFNFDNVSFDSNIIKVKFQYLLLDPRSYYLVMFMIDPQASENNKNLIYLK